MRSDYAVSGMSEGRYDTPRITLEKAEPHYFP